MIRAVCMAIVALAAGIPVFGEAQEQVVFRSGVALVRVDAQVVDRENRAITGLRKEDFILRDEGQPRPISHFASEDMAVDVLLLLDVSGSMRPHVERVASAARQALEVLGPDDRVAMMVFDRATRLRLPFRNNREAVVREFESLLRQENFNGGTDITRGLYDAAAYVAREGRRDARRAIVILTDDQTERGRDVNGVARELEGADTVMSALLAPDAMRRVSRRPLPTPAPGGWPDIILGRRPPLGGGGGPVILGSATSSAGTAEIAQRTGGDSMRVDEASALEWTLARIRQRYALHYHLPEGAASASGRSLEVELAGAARGRYPGAEVRYRRANLGGGGEPVMVSRAPSGGSSRAGEPASASASRRRRGVDETRRESGPAASGEAPGPDGGGWRRADEPEPQPAADAPAPAQAEPAAADPPGRWRRLKPGEQP